MAILLGAMIALAIGCAGPAPPTPGNGEPKETAVTLKIVVIDDLPLADAIRREWKARSKSPLDVVSLTGSDALLESPPKGDAVIYPVAEIGRLAEKGWIAPLPDVSLRALDAERADLSPLALQAECNWGGATWAIPFGSTGFTLYARADLLRDNGLSLPTTWEEYASVVRRLRASEWAKDPKHVVAVEPIGKGWGGLLLLARAASYLRHRGNYSTYFDFSSMDPLLDSPPMVKALEELVAASEGKKEANRGPSPSDCLDQFWKGQAALAIAIPGHPTKKSEGGTIPPADVLIGELPGSPQVFNPSDNRWEKRAEEEPTRIPLIQVSGRVGSLLTSSPNKPAAARALLLLSGPEWSPSISPESAATGPFRRSHLKQMGRWVESAADARLGKDLADIFSARFDAPLSMSSPSLPGGPRYLAALDAAVQSAVSGEIKPAAALAKAADAWRAITKELGLPAQKTAYRRQLGLKE